MIDGPYQNPNSPEPLPPEFETPLRELDRRLAGVGGHARAAAPAGLEERVFTASVAHLPGAAESAPAAARGRFRLAPSPGAADRRGRRDRPQRRWVLPRAARGQLALAASLGLAFVVTSVFMPDRAVEIPLVSPRVADAASLDWLGEEPIDEFDGAVALILDTATISSVDEVSGELDTILDDFGM